MIRDNQNLLNKIHLLLDAVMIIAAYAASWFIKFGLGIGGMDEGGVLPPETYFSLLYSIVPVYLIIYYLFKMYTPKRTMRFRLELDTLFLANTVGIFVLLAILYLAKARDFSRIMLFYFYILNFVCDGGYRYVLRRILRSMREKGYNQKHVLLVGYSQAAEAYIDRISANPEWGYKIYGILDDHKKEGWTYKGVSVIGEIDSLQEILAVNDLDEIGISLSLQDYDRLEEIVAFCEKNGVHTKFIPDYNRLIPTKPYTEDLNGLPVINIRNVPLTSSGNAFMKRCVDVVGAVAAIILFSPAMAVCAILIKTGSEGPVIFKQERVGRHNKPFDMYKFRTMVMQTAEDEAKGWTVKDDPRVTPVGRFMRRTSLDELPQLFNILKGDMSLVGPRPERPQFVEKFKEEIPRYMIKHQVRPGMTGWAQVNGYRGDTSIRKRIDYDIYYIENWTMLMDIKILILTLFKGFVNKNAY
ncbi:MAG: undecaprenyl-phosphate glucose phosphotransferase [Lachnospiraceae bacterium]|nr:undecaprenyl-phosphate glucose phosphotransferase [Lachnospiraceae bacterium]